MQGAVIEPKANMLPCHICLRGLDGQKRYRVNGDRVYTGAALMNGGILLPQMQGDYQPVELYLEEMWTISHPVSLSLFRAGDQQFRCLAVGFGTETVLLLKDFGEGQRVLIAHMGRNGAHRKISLG